MLRKLLTVWLEIVNTTGLPPVDSAGQLPVDPMGFLRDIEH